MDHSMSTSLGSRQPSPDLVPRERLLMQWSTCLRIVSIDTYRLGVSANVVLVAQVWSPYLYDKSYSPRYSIAFGVNSAMCLMAVLTAFALRWCLKRENNKLASASHDDGFRFVL
jgi:hypothetical protein